VRTLAYNNVGSVVIRHLKMMVETVVHYVGQRWSAVSFLSLVLRLLPYVGDVCLGHVSNRSCRVQCTSNTLIEFICSTVESVWKAAMSSDDSEVL
jgi:hypothetical protein